MGAHHVQPRLDLGAQVFEPEQVLCELGQTLSGLLPPRFDAANLRRFLQEGTPFRGRAHDDRLDVALVDDRVGIDREPGRGEDVDEVAPADAGAVEEVVAFTAAFDASLDRDLVIIDGQPSRRVVEHHRDLGIRRPRAPLAAGVDDLLHLLSAQVARLSGAQNPFDGVDDVGLARAVRADDRRDPAFESDLCLAGESLKAQQA